MKTFIVLYFSLSLLEGIGVMFCLFYALLFTDPISHGSNARCVIQSRHVPKIELLSCSFCRRSDSKPYFVISANVLNDDKPGLPLVLLYTAQ